MTRELEINPQHLVSQFLTTLQTSGTYLREPIEKLAEFASCENLETVKMASEAIFASLVEHLADSFEPQAVLLYNRLFAQMIQFCRRAPQGKALDEELAKFGLHSENDLLTRAEQLRYVRKFTRSQTAKAQIKLAVVLSRITIGADVAITSVIIERLKREFPNAQIVLIGNTKAAELLGGDARLRFGEINYKRAGTLTERLCSWLDVLQSVRELVSQVSREEYLIVDPDSRLLQLGLLPLSGRENLYVNQPSKAQIVKARVADEYLFFPSREFGYPRSHSLAQLTSIWLNAVFGGDELLYPQLHLQNADLARGKALATGLRGQDLRPVVAVNFGVGENPLKRISDEFEKQVVVNLLQRGAKIIFDKGTGANELHRANAVIAEAERVTYQNRKLKVSEFDETTIETLTNADRIDTDMLVWRGRIGLFAALVGESDLYVGYDSAGQHIASALGVGCVDVFAGYTSARMPERWKPTGKAETRVIVVDSLKEQVNSSTILSTVLNCSDELLK